MSNVAPPFERERKNSKSTSARTKKTFPFFSTPFHAAFSFHQDLNIFLNPATLSAQLTVSPTRTTALAPESQERRFGSDLPKTSKEGAAGGTGWEGAGRSGCADTRSPVPVVWVFLGVRSRGRGGGSDFYTLCKGGWGDRTEEEEEGGRGAASRRSGRRISLEMPARSKPSGSTGICLRKWHQLIYPSLPVLPSSLEFSCCVLTFI